MNAASVRACMATTCFIPLLRLPLVMRFAKFCSSDLPYHLVIRQILVIRFAIPSCDSDSTIARHEIRNSCGFRIPDSKTEQYKNSFFVRTVTDWNKRKTRWSQQILSLHSHLQWAGVLQRGCLLHIGSQKKNMSEPVFRVK